MYAFKQHISINLLFGVS